MPILECWIAIQMKPQAKCRRLLLWKEEVCKMAETVKFTLESSSWMTEVGKLTEGL